MVKYVVIRNHDLAFAYSEPCQPGNETMTGFVYNDREYAFTAQQRLADKMDLSAAKKLVIWLKQYCPTSVYYTLVPIICSEMPQPLRRELPHGIVVGGKQDDNDKVFLSIRFVAKNFIPIPFDGRNYRGPKELKQMLCNDPDGVFTGLFDDQGALVALKKS